MLIVEDGTGLANADSYVSVEDLRAYAAKFSSAVLSEVDADLERPLRVATAWIDATYRSRFPGQRRNGRTQALEWPRINACDREGWAVDYASVPPEVVSATCEAALREASEPASLAPDLERGGDIKRIAAGSVEIEYGARSTVGTVFLTIDNLLGSLLGRSSSLVGRSVRG